MIGKSQQVPVKFTDGAIENHVIRLYGGASMIGDPTAYVMRNGELVWVRPDPIGWLEAELRSTVAA